MAWERNEGIHTQSDIMEIIDSEYQDRRVPIFGRTISIPGPLRTGDFRFCLVRKREKRAIEKGWQHTANYRWNDPELNSHLHGGGNYGVIGGYGGLVVIDIDDETFIDPVRSAFPGTFTVRTRKGIHLYFRTLDRDIPSKTMTHLETGERVGELKGGDRRNSSGWGYVVGPGSVHPEGAIYEVIDGREITAMAADEFSSALEGADVSTEPIYQRMHHTDDRNIVRENPTRPRYSITGHQSDDPDYLKYLPHWYRTAHRNRDSSIFRGMDGRHAHLRICATLKKRCGEKWRAHCHDLTRWMFNEEYSFERTDRELNYIDEGRYYRLEGPFD